MRWMRYFTPHEFYAVGWKNILWAEKELCRFVDVEILWCFRFFLLEDESFIKNLMEHFTRQSFENSSNQRYFLSFIGKLENYFWNEITRRFNIRLCFSFYGGDRLCWWVHNYFNVSDWSWKINHSFEITQFIKFNESPQLSATTEFHTTYRKFQVFDNLIHIDILFFRRQK